MSSNGHRDEGADENAQMPVTVQIISHERLL
jgi:hypothetical protein